MTKAPSAPQWELAKATPPRRNPRAVYMADLAPGTRGAASRALEVMARLLTEGKINGLRLNWAAVRAPDAEVLRAKLAERYPAATANPMLAVLRGVLGAAFQLGQIGAEDYNRAIAVPSIPAERAIAGRARLEQELTTLLKLCHDGTPAGTRDCAMLAVLRVCGLRGRELCALDLADYDPTSGALQIRGQGPRRRTLYVRNGAARWLKDWLTVRGGAPGPLFVPVTKGCHSRLRLGRRYNRESLVTRIRYRAAQAGLPDLDPSDFRRRLVDDLIQAGVPMREIWQAMGHPDPPAMLERRQDEMTLPEVLDFIRVPYWKRP